MSSHFGKFNEIGEVFRRIPSQTRLRVINDVFVTELEQLGFDLAHELEPDAVASVFIAAGQISDRLNQLQETLDSRKVH